jgi:hypothetical protein
MIVDRGHFDGPLYLEKAAPEPGSLLSSSGGGKGRHGMPHYRGRRPVDFSVLIPCSLYRKGIPAKQIVQFGECYVVLAVLAMFSRGN